MMLATLRTAVVAILACLLCVLCARDARADQAVIVASLPATVTVAWDYAGGDAGLTGFDVWVTDVTVPGTTTTYSAGASARSQAISIAQASSYTIQVRAVSSTTTSDWDLLTATITVTSNIRLTAAAANTETNAVTALLSGGFLDLYTGPQPSTADTAITTQLRVASLPFARPAFASAVSGVSHTVSGLATPSPTTTSGTLAWFRAWRDDHFSPVLDGSIGTASTDLVLSQTFLPSNSNVTLSSFSITSPTDETTSIASPHNPVLTDLAADAKADALCALLNNGYLELYDGSPPASVGGAITTQHLLASLRFNATAFQFAAGGLALANAMTADPNAPASGTTTWFRVLQSDHATTVFDGSSAVLGLSSTTITAGQVVGLNRFVYIVLKRRYGL